jgi:hypothetical protein
MMVKYTKENKNNQEINEIKGLDSLKEGKRYTIQFNIRTESVVNAIYDGKIVWEGQGINLFFHTSDTNHFQKFINSEDQIKKIICEEETNEPKKRGRKPGSKLVREITTERFETGISINNLKNWTVVDATKEFLQNAVYAKSILKNKITIEHDEETKTTTIKNTPSGFEKSKLLIGESNQRGVVGSPGEFGEGMKVAFAVLLRNGIEIEVQTNNFKVVPSLEPSSLDPNVRVLWYNIENNWIKGGTTVIIRGIEKEDLEKARSFFYLLNDNFKTVNNVEKVDDRVIETIMEEVKNQYLNVDPQVLESEVLEVIDEINQERVEKVEKTNKKQSFRSLKQNTSQNCILGIAENGLGKIYINGVLIQEIPALFDYNFIEVDLMNRDRSSLDNSKLKGAIRRVVNELKNKKYIEILLRNAIEENETIENNIKFYSSDIKNCGNDKIWRKVKNQIWTKKVCIHGNNDGQADYRGFEIIEVGYEWIDIFTNVLGIKISDNISELAKKIKREVVKLKELTEIERKNLNWSKKMINTYYADLWKIKIVDNLIDQYEERALGLCDYSNQIIWIDRDILTKKERCFEVLVHETAHKESEASDKTVEFERELARAAWKFANREKRFRQ